MLDMSVKTDTRPLAFLISKLMATYRNKTNADILNKLGYEVCRSLSARTIKNKQPWPHEFRYWTTPDNPELHEILKTIAPGGKDIAQFWRDVYGAAKTNGGIFGVWADYDINRYRGNPRLRGLYNPLKVNKSTIKTVLRYKRAGVAKMSWRFLARSAARQQSTGFAARETSALQFPVETIGSVVRIRTDQMRINNRLKYIQDALQGGALPASLTAARNSITAQLKRRLQKLYSLDRAETMLAEISDEMQVRFG